MISTSAAVFSAIAFLYRRRYKTTIYAGNTTGYNAPVIVHQCLFYGSAKLQGKRGGLLDRRLVSRFNDRSVRQRRHRTLH
jgi:hypothetical protein